MNPLSARPNFESEDMSFGSHVLQHQKNTLSHMKEVEKRLILEEKSLKSSKTNTKEMLAQLDAKLIERSLRSFKEKNERKKSEKKEKKLMLMFEETDDMFFKKVNNEFKLATKYRESTKIKEEGEV